MLITIQAIQHLLSRSSKGSCVKPWKLSVSIVMTGVLINGNAWPHPVDLSPPSLALGSSDSKGYLEVWREIDDVGLDLSKDSYLPLRYEFSSKENAGGILGAGFYMPMLEAKNALIREQMMRALLPCGKVLYLRRDNVDPTKFQSLDGEWIGALNSNGDFTAWRNDSWTIFYHHGQLTSITTDEHHVFNWNYDSNTHMATSISKDGQSLVRIEPNQQGLVDAIVIDGKRYQFGYAERPIIEMLQGQPVVKQLAIALSSFKYPDGKTETFKFALTSERAPTVTLNDEDNKQTVYTWDAATNHIVTESGPDGNWTYNIGNIAYAFGLPPIMRTDSDGKTEEMTVDTKTGTYTSKALDGTTTVTKIFNTPGPLYQKVRLIEKTDTNGQTSTTYKASYDEMGRLIRNMDPNGFVVTYDYDSKGQEVARHTGLPSDPEALRKIKEKENALLSELNNARASTGEKDVVIENLAMFYIYQARASDKANALISLATQPDLAYRIKFYTIEGDPDATEAQKAARLKPLLKAYPYRADQLNTLIQMHEGTWVEPKQ